MQVPKIRTFRRQRLCVRFFLWLLMIFSWVFRVFQIMQSRERTTELMSDVRAQHSEAPAHRLRHTGHGALRRWTARYRRWASSGTDALASGRSPECVGWEEWPWTSFLCSFPQLVTLTSWRGQTNILSPSSSARICWDEKWQSTSCVWDNR